jgi:hypothetical protein
VKLLRRSSAGTQLGILFWRYSLSAAVRYLDDHLAPSKDRPCIYELRWFGIAIPFTNLCFGVIRRVKVPVTPMLSPEESSCPK